MRTPQQFHDQINKNIQWGQISKKEENPLNNIIVRPVAGYKICTIDPAKK